MPTFPDSLNPSDARLWMARCREYLTDNRSCNWWLKARGPEIVLRTVKRPCSSCTEERRLWDLAVSLEWYESRVKETAQPAADSARCMIDLIDDDGPPETRLRMAGIARDRAAKLQAALSQWQRVRRLYDRAQVAQSDAEGTE